MPEAMRVADFLLGTTARENRVGGMLPSTRLLSGEPGAALAHAARQSRASLVVVGTHGAGRAVRLLFGSTSDYLLQHCETPVLVVRKEWPPPHPGGRILLAADGSFESRLAASEAIMLCSATGSALRVAFLESAPPARRAHEEAVLRELAIRESHAAVELEIVVVPGHPAEALAEVAREPGTSLIVLGQRGRGPVERLLAGTTSSRLVQLANVPVLVVRA